MSALAKLVRLQPRCSFRLQASRTLATSSVAAARLHRPSLIQPVSSSWSPVSMRYFSTEPEEKKRRREAKNPSQSLFITNVPWDAGSEHLREIFSPFGEIVHIHLFPGFKGGHKGCARVDFSRLADATVAYQSSQAEPFFLMDRTLTVSYSHKTFGVKSRVLYFRDFKGNEADLRDILKEYKDQINKIAFIPPTKEDQLWDRGHIFFAERDVAEEALDKYNGRMTEQGCPLCFEYAMKNT
ncbi:hypothetical protein F5887DRAFT_960038 [Amanita rubescens]|nr:hypothetical protein F5887DRAFT_960038 [Amanita rubescens]